MFSRSKTAAAWLQKSSGWKGRVKATAMSHLLLWTGWPLEKTVLNPCHVVRRSCVAEHRDRCGSACKLCAHELVNRKSAFSDVSVRSEHVVCLFCRRAVKDAEYAGGQR